MKVILRVVVLGAGGDVVNGGFGFGLCTDALLGLNGEVASEWDVGQMW